jgi:TatD DNase family protein
VKSFPPEAKKPEKWQEGKNVKGRNEPAQIQQVLEVLAAIRGTTESELANAVYANTTRMFFSSPP